MTLELCCRGECLILSFAPNGVTFVAMCIVAKDKPLGPPISRRLRQTKNIFNALKRCKLWNIIAASTHCVIHNSSLIQCGQNILRAVNNIWSQQHRWIQIIPNKNAFAARLLTTSVAKSSVLTRIHVVSQNISRPSLKILYEHLLHTA